jgi:hypothetical protein
VTREAVESGFEQFLDDAIEATAEEFSVARVLKDGRRGPGGAAVDKLLGNSETVHRNVVEPELDEYRRRTVEQFQLLLDAVESGDPIDNHRAEILAAGGFTDEIRSDLPAAERERVRDDLFAHHRQLGQAVEPLLGSPESSFWDAARTELARDEAERLVATHFAFTEPLRTNRAAFEMETTIDVAEVVGGLARILGDGAKFDVEYTDEAIRAMRRAEETVIHEAKREIDRRFE